MSDPGKAVFLSYASQDAEAAKRICDALRTAGVEVWFDQDELVGGDAWDREIRQQIKECALLIPLISANTQARTEGYFRLEWRLADQRTHLMGKSKAFLLPVCIDATKDGEADVPDSFLEVQWTRLPGGEATPGFVERVKRLLEGTPAAALASRSAAGTRPPGTASEDRQPKLADYELLRRIGRGGYGDVWLARGLTGVYRAVKVVWRDRFEDPAPYEREFRGVKEAMALSRELGLLPLLHVGQDEAAGYFYYVMELADDVRAGGTVDPERYAPLTLKELKARTGRLPAAQCLAFAGDLAQALAGLHARGLVHRDIKPSNIVIVNSRPVLADIGLLASVGDAHTYVGTQGYLAPEGPGSPAGDVFALGKLLYELATGLDREEFPRLPDDLTDARERAGLFALNEILLRACDPDPRQRYRDGGAMLADLRARQSRAVHRRRLAWWFTAAAAAGLVVAAGLRWWPHPAPFVPAVTPPPVAAASALAAAPRLPEEENRSLAVLPFESFSADAADTLFTNGMHAEIIATISRLGNLRVISRNAALRYQGSTLSLSEIARELGVANIITGSVRRANGKVRIQLELRRARDEALLWSSPREDRDFADVWAVQDAMAEQVARVLQVRASSGWFAGARFMTSNDQAYQLFLEAREIPRLRGPGADAMRDQAKLCEKALALDGQFVAAAQLAAAAYSYWYGPEPDPTQRGYIKERARYWAERAAALMPGGAGDGALAIYYAMIEGDTVRSVQYAENEVRALPNDSNALNRMAFAQLMRGRLRESEEYFNRVLAVDPFHVRALHNRVYLYALMRRTDAFEAAATRSMELGGQNVDMGRIHEFRARLTGQLPGPDAKFYAIVNPAQRVRLFTLARDYAGLLAWAREDHPGAGQMNRLETNRTCGQVLALRGLGRTDEARKLAAETLARLEAAADLREDPRARDLRVWLLSLAGRGDEAIGLARALMQRYSNPDEAEPRVQAEALLAEVLADNDKAADSIALLRSLLRQPSLVTVPFLKLAPEFDPIRSNPAFQALLVDPANSGPLPDTALAGPPS